MKRTQSKTIIEPRYCAREGCEEFYTPLSNKSTYCCKACRLLANRLRRETRDWPFLNLIKIAKKNYDIIRLFKIGTYISAQELKNLGFNFSALFGATNENDQLIYTFGELALEIAGYDTFKLVKMKR